jgi:hypothetical protein
MKGNHISVMYVVMAFQGMVISNGIVLNTMEGNRMNANIATEDFLKRET